MSDVVLTEYTDPNCTWSWGAEPIVRHLEVLYGDQIDIEFVLGGLVEDFDDFHDAANDIEDPADVAPHWEEASRRHGMPVDVGVWEEDPPHSTWPASVATKAAEMQGAALGLRYLRRVRETALTERRNIADRGTLTAIAGSVGLDRNRFAETLEDDSARDAFRDDMGRMRSRDVRGFPTYELTVDGESKILGGFLPFERLERRILRFAPGLEPRELPPLRSFVRLYGHVATREVAELYGWSREEALERLTRRSEAGELRALERGNGFLWAPAGEDETVRRGTGEFALRGETPWRGQGEGRPSAA